MLKKPLLFFQSNKGVSCKLRQIDFQIFPLPPTLKFCVFRLAVSGRSGRFDQNFARQDRKVIFNDFTAVGALFRNVRRQMKHFTPPPAVW